MKKLIATLFVMTLGFSLVAVAGPTYDLSNEATGEISVLEPVQYNPGTKTTTYSASSTLKVNYTVTDSVNRRLLDLVKVKDKIELKMPLTPPYLAPYLKPQLPVLVELL